MSAPPPHPQGGERSSERPVIDLAREGQFETCGELKHYWYPACLSRELGDQPRRTTVFGLDIALYRDGSGQAHAVLDRCLHRSGALSKGKVINGTLHCPYHGWGYDTGGRCSHIPSLGPKQQGPSLVSLRRNSDHDRLPPAASASLVAKTPPEAGRLRTFPVLEQDGLVFVLPGGDLGKLRRDAFRVPYFHDPQWATYWMTTSFENGVTHLVENYMDVPHTTFVHRGWFRSPTQRRVPVRVELTDDQRVVATYLLKDDKLAGLGRFIFPKGASMEHVDEFIAPNVTRVDYHLGDQAGIMLNSHTRPIDAARSITYTAFCFRLHLGRWATRLFRPVMEAYTNHVIGQDEYMMGVQTEGLRASSEPADFAHSAADLQHIYVERLREWLANGAQAPAPEPETVELEMWL